MASPWKQKQLFIEQWYSRRSSTDANPGHCTGDMSECSTSSICQRIWNWSSIHLRKIAHIKWQENIPITDVIERCDISGIEAFLQAAQLRWTGHVIRMDDSRIPKRIFYGQLQHGLRRHGGQLKRY